MNVSPLSATQLRICKSVYGNTAKIYDLAILADRAQQSQPLRLIDLGCGTAATVEPVLRDLPGIEFVGIEPDIESARVAVKRLRGLNAVVMCQKAYSLPAEFIGRFDVALSFSTLEHVYRPDRYLQTAASALSENGLLLMNYDHGHFVAGSRSDSAKNAIGPVLARLGNESKYQHFVKRSSVARWCDEARLSVREEKFFNLRSFKELSGRVPEAQRQAYQVEWLAAELRLNSLIPYDDSLANELLTVNLVLAKHA